MQVNKITPKIVVRTSVRINLSATDWGLYTSSFPRVFIERVADLLNIRFNTSFNRGLGRDELIEQMHILMEDFGIYGANDTEPHAALHQLIKRVY